MSWCPGGRLARLGALLIAFVWTGRPAAESRPAAALRDRRHARSCQRTRFAGSVKHRLHEHQRGPSPSWCFTCISTPFATATACSCASRAAACAGERFTGRGSHRAHRPGASRVRTLAGSAHRELVQGDFTQLAVPLPKPLAPGAHGADRELLRGHAAPVFARSGYTEDFFCVAQWFPKLAKLERDGNVRELPLSRARRVLRGLRGLRVHRAHAAASSWWAPTASSSTRRTGQKQTRAPLQSRRALDAVWVAGKSLQVQREQRRKVAVSYLYAPGYELALRGARRETVRAGLEHFGRRFGAYPYPTLTVVVPPRRAAGRRGHGVPGAVLDGRQLATRAGLAGRVGRVRDGPRARAPVVSRCRSPATRCATRCSTRASPSGPRSTCCAPALAKPDAFSGWLPFSRFELERVGTWASTMPSRLALPHPAYTPARVRRERVRRSVPGARNHPTCLRSRALRAGAACLTQANWFSTRRQRISLPRSTACTATGFSARVLLPLLIEGKRVSLQHRAGARPRPKARGFVTEVRARRSGEVPLPTWLAAYDAQGKELTRVPFPNSWMRSSATIRDAAPGGTRGARSRPRAVGRSGSERSGRQLPARDARRTWISRALAAPDARRLGGTMRAWVSSVRALPMTFVIYLDRGGLGGRLGPARGARVHATRRPTGTTPARRPSGSSTCSALGTSARLVASSGLLSLARPLRCFRPGCRWHGSARSRAERASGLSLSRARVCGARACLVTLWVCLGSLLGLGRSPWRPGGSLELSAARLNDRVHDLGIACALLPALPLAARGALPGSTWREPARSTKAPGRAPSAACAPPFSPRPSCALCCGAWPDGCCSSWPRSPARALGGPAARGVRAASRRADAPVRAQSLAGRRADLRRSTTTSHEQPKRPEEVGHGQRLSYRAE